MSAKVLLWCPGCEESFTGDVRLVGTECPVYGSTVVEYDEDPTAGFTYDLGRFNDYA